MITEDLPRKTKSTSISNDTHCHVGFGCSITRVEKCTKTQVGEERPSIAANCNVFFSEGMEHKRGHANQPRTLSQGNRVCFQEKKLNPLLLSVYLC